MTEQTDIKIATPSAYLGSAPIEVNERDLTVKVRTERGLVVNSLLRADEWARLTETVQNEGVSRLNGVAHLTARNLVYQVNSLGVLSTEWSQVTEMTAADVSMTGQAQAERGRVEFTQVGRPLPIVSKEFMIPTRQLEASRLMGNPLDTIHAGKAARVVAEKLEDMLFNGESNVVFDGYTLYGYTTETNINSDTAANYGGGDWGTVSNIVPTISGMINAAHGDNFFGPFVCYASTTQFNQASLSYYTDGSGQTPAQRIRALDGIDAFYPSDTLTDGYILLVQMTSDVVDWARYTDISVVEWMSADGMVGFFKVMAVAAPRVKSDGASQSGIVLATGA